MITINKKRNCYGCWACACACPTGCITMQPDDEGFLYPQIDEQRCIKCNKCSNVCPALNAKPTETAAPQAYAAKNKNEDVRIKSTSGGVFSLLAQSVLDKNGVVYGAVYDNDFAVKHVCAQSSAETEKMRGSKYVQSAMHDCFLQAKEALELGKTVLFTGTPCQIAGLKTFLGKPYDNLITQDLICHGVLSPAVWKSYLAYQTSVHGAPVTEAAFRKKTENGKPSFYIGFANKEHHSATPYTKDPVLKLFLYNKCLRPSCHHCPFKGSRQSDVTLADLWSVQTVAKEMNDKKGISLVIVHTNTGAKLFESIQEHLIAKQVPFKRALKRNPSYFHSTPPSPARKLFFRDFRSKPFDKVIKRHSRLL